MKASPESTATGRRKTSQTRKWTPEVFSPRMAAVETRATGAELAPGALPGLPQMVVMLHARNCPMTRERGSGNSANKGGEDGHQTQR